MTTDDDDACTTLSASIPRLSASSTSSTTLRSFLDRNVPFVLTDAVTEKWRATQAWVVPGEEEDFVSMDLLEAAFRGSQVQVPVVECGWSSSISSSSNYGEEPRRECSLQEYAAQWRSGKAKARGLYLKDWHIVRALRTLQQEEVESGDASSSEAYYAVPEPLNDDWLNEWWDAPPREASHVDRDDDYRFLYLGPKGSTTGLHHDVLCSYSWSANLAGRKEWILFPPQATPLLYTDEAAQTTLRPIADVLKQQVAHLAIIQGPNEVLFVPSGWHHKVTNLTGCLSINHNWFNRSCLSRVWAFLQKEARAVQARLLHLKETFDDTVSGWERQCEVVLRANSAMNLTEFTDLLLVKAHRQLQRRREQEEGEEEEEGKNEEGRHKKDLVAIHAVLRDLAQPPHIHFLFPRHLEEEPLSLVRTERLRPQVEAWLEGEMKRIKDDAQ